MLVGIIIILCYSQLKEYFVCRIIEKYVSFCTIEEILFYISINENKTFFIEQGKKLINETILTDFFFFFFFESTLKNTKLEKTVVELNNQISTFFYSPLVFKWQELNR